MPNSVNKQNTHKRKPAMEIDELANRRKTYNQPIKELSVESFQINSQSDQNFN